MSTKATTISRSADRAAQASNKKSRLAAAEAYAQRAEAAARDAIKAAKEARAAVDAIDPARAAQAAKAATRAANSAESSAIVAKSNASKPRSKRETADAVLTKAVASSANYLVFYNGKLRASFANEDDALLLESELADLDLAHGVQSASCEVRTWRGGRSGGYLISAGRILTYQEDCGNSRGASHSGEMGR